MSGLCPSFGCVAEHLNAPVSKTECREIPDEGGNPSAAANFSGPLAHSAERALDKRRVVGAKPTRATTFSAEECRESYQA